MKLLNTPPLAVELAVACAPITQLARFRSPVGTRFLDDVFSVFPHLYVKCREASGPQGPEYHLAVIIIRLVRMNGCVNGVYHFSCSCCLGDGPGIELFPHPGRPSMTLCGQKSMYVIQS